MANKHGEQMATALEAVASMHADASRLFRDLDRWMDGHSYKAVYGSYATMDLSWDIKKGLYMAEGLFRHYVEKPKPTEVIAVNVAFFDFKAKLLEPIFIASRISYQVSVDGLLMRDHGWDPWSAYLYWNKNRVYGQILDVSSPAEKHSISRIAVIAEPLFSITSDARVHEVMMHVLSFPASANSESVHEDS